MHLVVMGLNHQTAPIELREKLSVPDSRLPEALQSLKALPAISECAVLSTCNRVEIYAYTCDRPAGIIEWAAEFCGVPQSDFEDHLYSHAGHKAVEHLFRVASGIDSLVVGEYQILGQVKDAYDAARRHGCSGPTLNALFRCAIAVGKRARTETEIGRGAFSVGSVAVQLARSIFDELSGRAVLVLGAGEMAELAVAHLCSSGAGKLLVANRTYSRAENLAFRFGGRAVKFDEIPSALETADIVIASTGAGEPVVTCGIVASAMQARRGQPIFFIDIAVPRDVESGVADIENVFVYNIDDLQAAVEADFAGREAAVAGVQAIIAEEVREFMRYFRTLDAVPVITALRGKFEEIRRSELEKLREKLPGLSEEQLDAIDSATRSIVNRICHRPLLQIKEYAGDGDSASKLETACDIFGVSPEAD